MPAFLLARSIPFWKVSSTVVELKLCVAFGFSIQQNNNSNEPTTVCTAQQLQQLLESRGKLTHNIKQHRALLIISVACVEWQLTSNDSPTASLANLIMESTTSAFYTLIHLIIIIVCIDFII
jgi:hypothetical protein